VSLAGPTLLLQLLKQRSYMMFLLLHLLPRLHLRLRLPPRGVKLLPQAQAQVQVQGTVEGRAVVNRRGTTVVTQHTPSGAVAVKWHQMGQELRGAEGCFKDLHQEPKWHLHSHLVRQVSLCS